jgi:B12-binding domain/radical SAM domain protein
MPSTDLILLHAPHIYDFRRIPQLFGPVSDLVPSTPVFEMYPVGFTSLAEYLGKAGYHVRLVNLAWRMMKDSKFDAEAFIAKLIAPLFGIDLHWMVHAHGSVEIARLVKKVHPEAKVIFGGFSASYFWKELLAYPSIDYVMRGDSTEEPMARFLKALPSRRLTTIPNLAWKDAGGQIHENPINYVPDDISTVMKDHYGTIIRSVLRYRDLISIVPFKRWLKYPVAPVFTCRGCSRQCVFCGGSQAALKRVAGRDKAVFRSARDIYKDIRNISSFSRGPVFIVGDLREAGEETTYNVLKLLQQEPVKNTIMFELFDPAPPRLIEEMALAAPGFSLDISPHSHDPAVRRASGMDYSNEDLEATIQAALKNGASRLELFYLIGLPHQTRESVLATIDYCEYLLRKCDGDRRLFLFIGPLAPFLDPGSLAFEKPTRYGYKVLFRSLEEHRQALTQPSWKYTLNYETEWMTRQDIIDVTYEAIARLTRIKAKYGQISQRAAEVQLERITRSIDMEKKIDDLMASGATAELASLKPEMDKLNNFRAVERRQMELPMGIIRLRYVNALWQIIQGKLKL